MNKIEIDQHTIFYKALLNRDPSFDGIFIVGVKTTGIFCRPTCSARKPKKQNVEFFSSTQQAIMKGYRACKICKPMMASLVPSYIEEVLYFMEKEPTQKIRDSDLKKINISPIKVRRWFQKNHNITFHTYQRMFRINNAFNKVQQGQSVIDVAFESGYNSLSGFNSSYKKITGYSPMNSKDKTVVNLQRIETPLGTMIACSTPRGICMLEFSDRKMLETELKQITKYANAPIIQGESPHIDLLKEELKLYFAGQLKEFSVSLDPIGTEFQKKVWNVLIKIPYGQTWSYAKEAEILGRSSAVRAVANANGMNKISIIIPCHRVIGSDGTLTGYGGGLWRKKRLLEIEQNSYLEFQEEDSK